MNKKIALSGLSILTALALIGGATFAFFSDTETSTGNTFTAGDLDLTIDNTSYLNGEAFSGSTWQLADLDDEEGPSGGGAYLFFNFDDLKPGDEGEDTISLHVTNDSWACVEFSFEDSENGCGGDELGSDTCDQQDDPGELSSELNFLFWVDDGDNVLETDEPILDEGPASDLLNTKMVLADSGSIPFGGPLLAKDGEGDPKSYFIGKAWCYGTLTENRVLNNLGVSPAEDSGVLCDGSPVTNASQTDSLGGDVTFTAEQWRNNPNFQCNPPEPTPTPTPTPG